MEYFVIRRYFALSFGFMLLGRLAVIYSVKWQFNIIGRGALLRLSALLLSIWAK